MAVLCWSGLAGVAALALGMSCGRAADPLPGFPRLVLWAWERPENLSYIIPASTGVAYLAETMSLEANRVERRPRFQPLWVPDHTPLIAVVRIESHAAVESRPAAGDVARRIAKAIHGSRARALQIDFDARSSERRYYRDLMEELRHALPPDMPLEMTALVSWCERDDWIGRMPVVDAVPMFFRMGADPHSGRERLREPLCRASVGVSTDEFDVFVPQGRRTYVFTNQPWTEKSYRAVLEASKKWR